MKQSQLFPQTKKEAPRDAESINHKLLVRAGFIDQLMTGSWSILPLGWRVINKINNIIREELNAIGSQEVLMPLMHPKEVWNETGRWDTASEVMYQLKDTREKEFALSFTHEEIVIDILRKHIRSYKDLPVAIYHFSTKFRNEPRPTGGILRGREFLMKDLYSAHVSNKDMEKFYEKVTKAYLKIFGRMGFETYITEAAGGVFTSRRTREFQVIADAGEDTIFVKPGTKIAFNKEVFEGNESEFEKKKTIEVGNIFPFGTEKYSEKMNAAFTDQNGQKQLLHFASYGIGITRLLGTAVEVYNDDKGIIWPDSIAPYQVHLIELSEGLGKVLYEYLKQKEVDVLWDDTERGAGEKFADSDLIGIPVRLVVSKKTGSKIEWKKRNSDEIQLLSLNEVTNLLKTRN